MILVYDVTVSNKGLYLKTPVSPVFAFRLPCVCSLAPIDEKREKNKNIIVILNSYYYYYLVFTLLLLLLLLLLL